LWLNCGVARTRTIAEGGRVPRPNCQPLIALRRGANLSEHRAVFAATHVDVEILSATLPSSAESASRRCCGAGGVAGGVGHRKGRGKAETPKNPSCDAQQIHCSIGRSRALHAKFGEQPKCVGHPETNDRRCTTCFEGQWHRVTDAAVALLVRSQRSAYEQSHQFEKAAL